jgi:hypothetical protein
MNFTLISRKVPLSLAVVTLLLLVYAAVDNHVLDQSRAGILPTANAEFKPEVLTSVYPEIIKQPNNVDATEKAPDGRTIIKNEIPPELRELNDSLAELERSTAQAKLDLDKLAPSIDGYEQAQTADQLIDKIDSLIANIDNKK